MTQPLREVLDAHALADLFGWPVNSIRAECSKRTRQRRTANGETPLPYHTLGRRVYFLRSEVLAWFQSLPARADADALSPASKPLPTLTPQLVRQ